MDKELLIDKLREHGIELVLVTDRVYQWHQIDMAREDYDVPADAVVPTIEQYKRIIDIVGEYGLCIIMEEYMKVYDLIKIWSSPFSNERLTSWCLYFNPLGVKKTYIDTNGNSCGFSVAFWRILKTEEEKDERIEKLEKENEKLKKQIEKLEKEKKQNDGDLTGSIGYDDLCRIFGPEPEEE